MRKNFLDMEVRLSNGERPVISEKSVSFETAHDSQSIGRSQ